MPLRSREEGGVALVAAFLVLALLAALVLAAGRNVLRETATCGEALQGARAVLAAEAGLEGFFRWSGEEGAALLAALPADGAWHGVLEFPLPPSDPGSPFRQSASIRVRRLGSLPGEAGQPAPHLWQVRSQGRSASGSPGDSSPPFIHMVECMALSWNLEDGGAEGAAPPGQGPPAAGERGPALRPFPGTWRTIRWEEPQASRPRLDSLPGPG
jgi:hypothetical protein